MRATFYYPWFPETWPTKPVATPSLGPYESRLGIYQTHIALMEYARIRAAFISWWGPDSPYSLRVDDCLDAAVGTKFKWGLYYEPEGYNDPDIQRLSDDLTYAYVRWAHHPSFLHRGGKPVMFVYAGANDQAAMVYRWQSANQGRFHISLKVFDGFQASPAQPDSWHQYAPANNVQDLPPYCYSISPGFAMSGQSVRLPRDEGRFARDARAMEDSAAYWKLVTTFNEWGEGTAIEPAEEWGSRYLDILAGVK
jgi:hypothetical protein